MRSWRRGATGEVLRETCENVNGFDTFKHTENAYHGKIILERFALGE